MTELSKFKKYIREIEKIKGKTLNYREATNEETDDFIRKIGTNIIKSLKEEDGHRIIYNEKLNSYYFTETRSNKKFRTDSMSYDEAYKIIEDNDLKNKYDANLTPQEILEEAKNSLVLYCVDITGKIKEPIFFETNSR